MEMLESEISQMPEEWQTATDFSETNWMMWKYRVSCDIQFHVGSKRETIPAHTFILVSRSSVFFKMFRGLLAEKSDIVIPEIESDTFTVFLRYLYTNQVNITADNVMTLLYAAKKYDIGSLSEKCVTFLDSILNVENACNILEQSHLYNLESLGQRALQVIFLNAEAALRSPGFKDIGRVCLEMLLSSDELRTSEVNVFRSALFWSEAECLRQGREVTSKSKFEVLKELLKFIRFRNIDRQILGCFLDILDPCWSKYLNRLLNSEDCTAVPQRLNPVSRVIRFEKFDESQSWTYRHGRTDAIIFSCSNAVKLHGIIVYNAYLDESVAETETYSICCHIEECLRQDKGGDVLEDSVIKRTVIVNPKDDFIELYYDKPVQLSPYINYTIELLDVSGKDSKRGIGGQSLIQQDGVVWTFSNSNKSKNGTNISHGQIPGLV